MGPTQLELTKLETVEARQLAEGTYTRFKGEPGHYRNLPRSHLLGKLGEVGVERWIRAAGLDPDPAFRDPNRLREADLLVAGGGIEVKTWRAETWEAWGRCVTPAQIRGIARKCHAVVWAIVDDAADPVTVEIVGWNTPDEISATEVHPTGPDYRPVMNHQVAVDAVRDPDDLRNRLRAGLGDC